MSSGKLLLCGVKAFKLHSYPFLLPHPYFITHDITYQWDCGFVDTLGCGGYVSQKSLLCDKLWRELEFPLLRSNIRFLVLIGYRTRTQVFYGSTEPATR